VAAVAIACQVKHATAREWRRRFRSDELTASSQEPEVGMKWNMRRQPTHDLGL
jgi:hypothetical protein